MEKSAPHPILARNEKSTQWPRMRQTLGTSLSHYATTQLKQTTYSCGHNARRAHARYMQSLNGSHQHSRHRILISFIRDPTDARCVYLLSGTHESSCACKLLSTHPTTNVMTYLGKCLECEPARKPPGGRVSLALQITATYEHQTSFTRRTRSAKHSTGPLSEIVNTVSGKHFEYGNVMERTGTAIF